MAKRRETKKVVSKKHVARQERERQQSALIRYIAIGVVALVVLLVGYGMLDEAVLKERRAVASVNGEKITVGQFEARVRLERDSLISQYAQYIQLAQSFGMDFNAQLSQIETRLYDYQSIGQSVLETMTYELLYRQIAQKEGITFSAEEIESGIQEYLGYYANGTPTPEPEVDLPVVEAATLSPEQLELVTVTPEPTTAPTSTPLPETEAAPTEDAEPTAAPVPTMTATAYTYEGYQLAYEQTLPLYEAYGLDEAGFRFLFEANLYYTALYDMVTADVQNEGQEYIWARHILVEDPQVAEEIRGKILAGEDFSALATEYSIDPSAATNNGDLGWFASGQMVAPFEEAAFAIEKIGDISEVVPTDFGYHIIQLLGRETRPMDANAYQALKDSVFQEWIVAKYEESDIELFDIWQSSVPTEPDLQQSLAAMFGQ
jgi:parvulin-like peptidyl-prolyl isomerase